MAGTIRLFTCAALATASILCTGCAGSGTARTTGDVIDVEDEVARNPTVRLADLIRQHVPGVHITESAGGGIRVRLRGAMSFTAETAPLFVVDNVPIHPSPDGTLPGILMTDIASIRVYKDPSDTLRWGMRGANGVIVVETKTGGGP